MAILSFDKRPITTLAFYPELRAHKLGSKIHFKKISKIGYANFKMERLSAEFCNRFGLWIMISLRIGATGST
jgi:hypothetical protein